MSTITTMSSAPQVPRHLPGVVGAATLNTPGLREMRASINQLITDGGIILIDGKPGVGKTFGTQEILSSLEVRVHWVDMPDTPKGKEANARIYAAVSGQRPKRRMTEYELTEETVDVLEDLEAVLVIDEAQNMTRSALRAIRFLHDRPSTRVLIILIGSGVTNTVLAVPELDSRVSRRTMIQELRRTQVIPLLRDLHPLLAATSEETLIALGEYAKGNLRNWARILEVARSLGVDMAQGITSTNAKHIIRAISGHAR